MEASVAARPFAAIGRHISHSQVSLFDKCQLAWWFKYIKGISKPPTVQMLVGSCYHKALAFNFSQKCISGVDLPTAVVLDHYYEAFEDSVRSGNIDAVPGADLSAYREPVARLLQHYYEEYVVDKMEPILVEHEMVRAIPGCDRLFAGIIDVQLSDGTMIDFKVTSRKWSDKDIADNKQSTAYSMLYGYDTDFEFHIGLRANVKPTIQVVKTRRTRDDVDQYIQHLQDVVVQMKDLEQCRSEPTPYTGFCNDKMCQYYGECQEWKYGNSSC